MISVVNGYVCLTSCDAAAAKHGKNPAAAPGSPLGTPDKKGSGFDATILDGALKDFATTTASASHSAVAQRKVNLLA